MGIRSISETTGAHIYQPGTTFRHHFERVRIDRDLKGHEALAKRLASDDELLDQLAEISAARGLPYLNILQPQPRLQFVQETCRAMIIPAEVLGYVLANDLPLSGTLGSTDYVNRNHDEFGVRGEGRVIALKGAFIGDEVRFETFPDKPIVLRENCQLAGELTIRAGAVVQPGQHLTGSNLFLHRPIR